MGNCCVQDETQKPSSVKTLKKVDSVLSQAPQECDQAKVCLKDFLSQGEIGRGQFGKVLKVKMKCNQTEYAMKVIKKADIIKFGLVEHTMLEKNVLGVSKNPFVIKLKYSFQTEQKLYLVMELVNGGQLLKVMSRQQQKRFTHQQAQFCAAEVVLGLEYMHETLKVIYRDLKPENILVTEEGHLKLTDFGLSKKYETIDMKFFTFAGTPEYLAPEILNNSGHNFAVDWWCLGILIYEMLTGHTPFRDRANNFRNIERQIKDGTIMFPEYVTNESKDIISKLLTKDPTLRLGYKSISELKNHSFFQGIVWNDIYNLRVKSPIMDGILNQGTLNQPIIAKKIFETPQSQMDQTSGNFEGFSVNHDEY